MQRQTRSNTPRTRRRATNTNRAATTTLAAAAAAIACPALTYAMTVSSAATAPALGVFISQSDGSDGVVNFGNPFRTQWRENGPKHGDPGMIFETTDAYTLETITLRLNNGINSNHVGKTWFMDVLSLDGANNVTANLQSESAVMISATGAAYLTFDITDIALAPNARYAFRWGLIGGPYGGITDFRGDNDAVWPFGMVAYAGAGVSSQGTAANFTDFNANNSFEFYLTGTLVPTPAAAGPGAIGLIALAARRLRPRTRR